MGLSIGVRAGYRTHADPNSWGSEGEKIMTGAHVDMPTLPNRPGPLLSTNLAGMGKPSFGARS